MNKATTRAATAKAKGADGLLLHPPLNIAAAVLMVLGALAAVIGIFLILADILEDEETGLIGALVLGGGLHLFVVGLILHGLHEIARNTANLNRLHQPKARSNGP